ncbi:hypothetical protein RyT2_25530 [Pseudolactococcus yaeyamensis]
MKEVEKQYNEEILLSRKLRETEEKQEDVLRKLREASELEDELKEPYFYEERLFRTISDYWHKRYYLKWQVTV